MTVPGVGYTPPVGPAAPTDTSSVITGAGGKLGKDEFLKLLTTQLRYQDPLNPQDGQQMAAQLAQFSSVEQLQNISQQLTSQQTQSATMVQAVNNSVALSAIGKMVTAPGDVVTIPATSAAGAPVTVDVGAAGTATLTITDDSGAVVGTRPLGSVGAGLQTFTVGQAGASLPAGNYHYKVDVTGSDGKAVTATTYMTVRADGVSYSTSGAVLTSGTLTIPIGGIIKIQS
jgi:flagellar basal-body rod modification protein FlgD